MLWVGGVVGLLVLGLLLAAEVSFEVSLERTTTISARWRTRWLGGLVRVDGSTEDARRAGPPAKTEKTPRKPLGTSPRTAPSRRGSGWFGHVVRLLSTPGLIERALRLLADIGRAISVDRLHGRGTVGLDDPADTGMFYGATAPLLAFASARGFDISWYPDFEHTGVRGACGGRVRFRPLGIIWSCVRFACSRPALRALGRLLVHSWGR